MCDNCRSYCVNLSKAFLLVEGIMQIQLPACAPDMKPIEHFWIIVARHDYCQILPLQSLQKMESALLQECDRISKLIINRPIDSITQRCLFVLYVQENQTILHNKNDFLWRIFFFDLFSLICTNCVLFICYQMLIILIFFLPNMSIFFIIQSTMSEDNSTVAISINNLKMFYLFWRLYFKRH